MSVVVKYETNSVTVSSVTVSLSEEQFFKNLRNGSLLSGALGLLESEWIGECDRGRGFGDKLGVHVLPVDGKCRSCVTSASVESGSSVEERGECGVGSKTGDTSYAGVRHVSDGDAFSVQQAQQSCNGVGSGDGNSHGYGGSGKRGKWYYHNKDKRRRRKLRRDGVNLEQVESTSGGSWRQGVRGQTWRGVGSCETVKSDSGCDTLNSAELKARETLALRRVAENEVAIAKAKALVASYADEAKSEALQELAALRIAQRANEARAKSQSSWKKCEESLGSLGSTGSAGEFWMKREVAKGKQWEKKYLQLKKQSEHMYASATQQVRDELLAMDGTITTVGSDCIGDSDNVDDYLAQNVGAAEKDLATMEDEFRNFKF